MFPLQNPLSYSSATAYIVIVMVALAGELLALLILIVASLLGALVSASEALVSDATNTGNPATSATRAIKKISLFNFTISLSLYALLA